MTYWELQPFLGKECVITIAKEPKLVELQGILVSVSAEGDADIALPNGQVIMIWPVLEAREAE